MSENHGLWMRTQRQARGWNVPQMGRKLRGAATSAGDAVPSRDCPKKERGLRIQAHVRSGMRTSGWFRLAWRTFPPV
jgi:hypothetical protein